MKNTKHYTENVTKAPRRSYGNGDTVTPCSRHNPNLPASLPIIGLGCSSFSTAFFHDAESISPSLTNPPSREHPLVVKWIETIHHAILNCGINLLDTSPWYGHGISEVVIGFAMEELAYHSNNSDGKVIITRKDLVINTKVGRYDADPIRMFDFSAKRVRSSVLMSIERMKCSYIDVIQLHDPEFAPSLDLLIDETIPALLKLRDKDKLVKAVGMTGYSLKVQHELIHRTHARYGVFLDQSLTYCHYNLHDQSLFHSQAYTITNANSTIVSSFANYCREHNIGLLAAAPLSMGLLTEHSNPPTWHPASTALKDACKKAADYCATKNINLATMALMFAMGQDKLACTIVGMKDVKEVDRAIEVARRFVGSTINDRGMMPLLSLYDVLTQDEKSVLDHLLDQENGPFAAISKSGDFEWDGVEVENFWKTIPCHKLEIERKMRLN